MNKDCLVTGIAMGMLVCCFFMQVFPKQKECMVNVRNSNSNVSMSYVGVSYD